MAILSKSDFITYCLRDLGAPVITINVTDDQLDDRFSEALKKMSNFHYSGYEKVYYKHQLTTDDIANQYITIPDNIDGVQRVFPLGGSAGSGSSSGDYMFNVDYQLRLNDIWDLSTSTVGYYVQLRQYTSLLDMVLSGSNSILFRFNRVQHRCYIDLGKSKFSVGNYVLLEVTRPIDPDEFPEIYEEPWFKSYMIALIKKQWGSNIKKFTAVQMIGGVTVDGQAIYNEAIAEIAQLEQELRDTWEEPVCAFLVG